MFFEKGAKGLPAARDLPVINIVQSGSKKFEYKTGFFYQAREKKELCLPTGRPCFGYD